MNTSRRPRVLTAGASCRSAAQALSYFDCEITAIDLFGDWDLRALANVLTASDMQELVSMLHMELCSNDDRYDFILLCGGIENHSELLTEHWLPIRAVSSTNDHTYNAVNQNNSGPVLLGADLRLMNRLRTVDELRLICSQSNVGLAADYENFNAVHEWLAKPIHSCGGLGIRKFDIRGDRLTEDERLEPFIPGIDLSVIVARESQGWNVVMVSESLPKAWFPQSGLSPDRHEFVYGGSQRTTVEKKELPESLRGQIDSFVGSFSTYESRFLGDWQPPSQFVQFDFRLESDAARPDSCTSFVFSDAVHNGTNQLWLLECNPRWTASMELLTIQEMRSLFIAATEHRGHLKDEKRQVNLVKKNGCKTVFAKRTIFASETLTITQRQHEMMTQNSFYHANSEDAKGFGFADIPMPGLTIGQGEPLTSVLFSCESDDFQARAMVDAIAMLRI